MHLQHKDEELIAAVECGNEAAVSTLLAGGADANTISRDGDRALMLAARDGYTGCINTPFARDGPESAFLADRRASSSRKRIEPLGSGVFQCPYW